jgi:putative two-component system response regulator
VNKDDAKALIYISGLLSDGVDVAVNSILPNLGTDIESFEKDEILKIDRVVRMAISDFKSCRSVNSPSLLRFYDNIASLVKYVFDNNIRSEILIRVFQGFHLCVTDLMSRDSSCPLEIKNRILPLFHEINNVISAESSRRSEYNFALSMIKTAEMKNRETANHLMRVYHYTKFVASVDFFKMAAPDIKMMAEASMLHDIGKIFIDDSVLTKKGSLTTEEKAVMDVHCEKGYQNLIVMGNSPFFKMAADIAMYHHHRYYVDLNDPEDVARVGNHIHDPTGKYEVAGACIPLSARIFCIGDVYDALRSKRVYKEAFSHELSVDLILGDGCRRVRPGDFDPNVLQIFKDNLLEFDRIYEKYAD